jgi:small subunit ribosomal protein S5
VIAKVRWHWFGSGNRGAAAIQKAINYAKKHLVKVPLYKKTLPHEIRLNFKAAKILLKPAPEGTGLKVGSVARIILDLPVLKTLQEK